MEDDDDDKPWLSTHPLPKVHGLPDYGFRLRLDHEFKEKCKPFFRPRLRQMRGMVGMAFRYAMLWLSKYRQGKKLFIDNLNLCPWRPIYGAPIGGIGCGTIGRGYRGEFCRFQLVPGIYEYDVVEANQFIVVIRRRGETIYQQVLSPLHPSSPALRAWRWQFPPHLAHYHALYPRAWTVYEIPEHKVRLICRQVSPVIPHDYQDSSLPVAVFAWRIERTGVTDDDDDDDDGDDPLDVSVVFVFRAGGQGGRDDRRGGAASEAFGCDRADGVPVGGDAGDGVPVGRAAGVTIRQQLRGMTCTFALAARPRDGVSVTHQVAFNPNCAKDTRKLWAELSETGHLGSAGGSQQAAREDLAAAVCASVTVPPRGAAEMEFALAWDMPRIHFGAAKTSYYRRYTRYFGHSGNAAPALCDYAFDHYALWEEKIEAWQRPILSARSLPAWYKSALFNELYYISDGGTVWLDPVPQTADDANATPADDAVPAVIREYGKFAYLEGHEYRMYNTYDVHHYASFALLMLWPKLQMSLQYDIASCIPTEHPRKVRYCMNGEWGVAKAADCVPHDIGDPEDEPWTRINAYTIHPTQEWKDLNTKFVLQVYRDYTVTQDKQYLADMYPLAKRVIEHSLRWDVDGDGIIDNAGFADQTYDAWTVTGASAYCGGMWLAGLKMTALMADHLGLTDDCQRFNDLLEKAKRSFEEKLWNGRYYNYDCSTNAHHDSIQSDQLAGHWFLKASKIPDDSVFPRENILKALDTIFRCNVLPFGGGRMGAINGARPDGTKDVTSIQSEEFWTGVIYSLSAIMIQEGLLAAAWQTAYGCYHTCYERYGLAFQTPEAYFDDCQFRSLGYMRPLAVWAMQHAIETFHPSLLQ